MVHNEEMKVIELCEVTWCSIDYVLHSVLYQVLLKLPVRTMGLFYTLSILILS